MARVMADAEDSRTNEGLEEPVDRPKGPFEQRENIGMGAELGVSGEISNGGVDQSGCLSCGGGLTIAELIGGTNVPGRVCNIRRHPSVHTRCP